MYQSNKTASDYLRRLSGQEKEPVVFDHNYVKNWNAHPDSHRTKPARMLFMNVSHRKKGSLYYEDEIDVVNDDVPFESSPFETQKSKNVISELERALKYHPKLDCFRPERDDILLNATPRQRRIYNGVMEVLNSDILAKAAYAGKPHESVKRRIASERFSKKLKLVFATNFWDFDVIIWIHKLILDELSFCYVLSYLSLLQALRAKIPNLVDRILKKYSGPLGYEYLSQLLKKDCDPVTPVLNQQKPKKLPSNPFLLISCAGFDAENAEESSRFRFWTSHLNALCKTIYVPLSDDGGRLNTADDILKFSVISMKQKVNQLKNHFPNRPVILAGWTIGALIACHVALEMPVDAVLCFGFPLWGVNGSRGDLDDPLLSSSKPILFIVGQNANMCSTDDIEDFRSRIQAETGCVIIGGADDLLRVSPMKMLDECITQPMVDRCILDEISDFLHSTLMKGPSTSSMAASNPLKGCPTIWEENSDGSDREPSRKRRRRKPKEYSPELQPARKRGRHSVSKEVSSKPQSPSSSETSSSGSFKKEKKNSSKAGKRKPSKRRVGRPPNSSNRRKPKPVVKPIIKPIVNPVVAEQKKRPVSLKFKFKPQLLAAKPVLPTSPTEPPVIEAKPPVPFALNILPKKNEAVDVEKAFGFDSFFLPRPLTPAELEEARSAEEAEKDIAELEANISVAESAKIQTATTLPEVVNSGNKTIMTLAEQPAVVSGALTKVSVSATKPILSSMPDIKKPITVSVKSPSFRTVFQQGKLLNSGSMAQLKGIAGMNLIGSPVSQVSSINVPKTMITIPAGSANTSKTTFTFPASSANASKNVINIPASSTNSSKAMITVPASSPSTSKAMMTGPATSPSSSKGMITAPASSPSTSKAMITIPASSQSTSKAMITVPASSPSTSKAMITIPACSENASKTMITVPGSSTRILVSGTTLKTQAGKVLKLLTKAPVSMKKRSQSPPVNESPEQQEGCNLSLLSRVAGMTEPIKDARKAEPVTSSSATLVKLAAPEKSHQQLKRFQVIRSLQARSPIARVETPEEMVEKQLAIQALNKSIGVEGSSATQPAKESGYSICFTKPDGSILSRSVPRSAPVPYVRQSLLPPQPGRGRARPVLTKQTYPFYQR